jgi:hypothetical protein
MLSFRTDEQLAADLDAEVARSGVAKTDLLNQALRELLYRRRCERDAEAYQRTPLTGAELAPWATEAWPDDDDETDWGQVFGG